MENQNNLFLENIWNEGLDESSRQRKIEPRDYIYSSEIGKSYWDRFMKMKGVQPTEIKDPRVLRKFAMGNIIEELVGRMLAQVGFLKTSQEHIEIPATANTLKITGRIDFIAGVHDWQQSLDAIKNFHTEQKENSVFGITETIATKVVEKLANLYPQGFADTPLEIKSVNSMLFWAKKDYLDEAYPHHIMQLYTYLKAKNLPIGRIVYISKDDATIKEMTVKFPDPALEVLWNKDVQTLSKYFLAGTEPPKPEMIVFDKRGCVRFQKTKVKYKTSGEWKENWQVKFSDYFRLLTGFEDEDKWIESLKPEMKRRNDELKEEFLRENHL